MKKDPQMMLKSVEVTPKEFQEAFQNSRNGLTFYSIVNTRSEDGWEAEEVYQTNPLEAPSDSDEIHPYEMAIDGKVGAVVDNASQKVAFTGVEPHDIQTIYMIDNGIQAAEDWLNTFWIAVEENRKRN